MTDQPDALALPADDSQASEPQPETSLVPVEIDPAEPPEPGTALADLRSFALAQPIDRMLAGLDEYVASRDAFRAWLLRQLKRGVHYGFPPGCKPRLNANGDAIIRVKDKGGGGWHDEVVPKEQWKHHENLYKGGAQFVIDLMGVRAEFERTEHGKGDQISSFIVTCRLYSRAGELLGEGQGARRVGKPSGRLDPENTALKMAEKSAQVDAVLNTYGLGDLFGQDMEDAEPPQKVENPSQAPDSPKAETRTGRVTLRELNILKSTWADKHPGLVTDEQGYPLDGDYKLANFSDWVRKLAGLIPEFDVNDPNAWPRDLCNTCLEDLKGDSK